MISVDFKKKKTFERQCQPRAGKYWIDSFMIENNVYEIFNNDNKNDDEKKKWLNSFVVNFLKVRSYRFR